MPEEFPKTPVENFEWSDSTFYRRSKHGLSLEVNALYAGVNSPEDPEFPGDAPMNRQNHRLDPETLSFSPEQQVAHVSGEVVVKAAGIEEPSPSSKHEEESEYETYLRKVFAPHEYLLDADIQPEEHNYDHLFADDEVYEKAVAGHRSERDRFGNKLTEWQPTKETRDEAKNVLLQAARHDVRLRELIKAQAGKIDISDPYKVVDAIRTDTGFRLEIGKHYLNKINILARDPDVMPERIVSNRGKSPDKGGYPVRTMSSREYAAVLCLAMLDGTFNRDAVSSIDYIEHNAKGETVTGQHRMAAHIALGA
ncbi:MAG: hypothetical protein WC498_02580 [Candidatus Saccharimonadales bacterium]